MQRRKGGGGTKSGSKEELKAPVDHPNCCSVNSYRCSETMQPSCASSVRYHHPSWHGRNRHNRHATLAATACSRALETHRIRYAPRRIEHKLRGKLMLDPADLLYRARRRPRTADQQQTRSGGVAMWRQARGARGAGAYSPPMEG